MGTSIEEHFVGMEGIAMFKYQLVELGVREAKDRYSRTLRQVAEGCPDGGEVIVVVHRHRVPHAAIIHPELLKRLVSVFAASERERESKGSTDPHRPPDPGPSARAEVIPSSEGETSGSVTPNVDPPSHRRSGSPRGVPRLPGGRVNRHDAWKRRRPGTTTPASGIVATLSPEGPIRPGKRSPLRDSRRPGVVSPLLTALSGTFVRRGTEWGTEPRCEKVYTQPAL